MTEPDGLCTLNALANKPIFEQSLNKYQLSLTDPRDGIVL